MTPQIIYLATGVILFSLGIIALIIRKDPIIQVISINIIGVGIFIWFIANGFDTQQKDSLPHALVLTGIVVAVSATAFALLLLVRSSMREKSESEE